VKNNVGDAEGWKKGESTMTERNSIIVAIVGLVLIASLTAGQPPLGQGNKPQAAGGGDAGAQAQGLPAIFDGKTLNGWKIEDQGWAVKDGKIIFDGTIPSIRWSCAWLQLDWSQWGPFRLSYEARGTSQEVGLHLGYTGSFVPTEKKTKWHKFILDHDGKEGIVTVDGIQGRKAPMALTKIGLCLRGPSKDKDVVEFRNLKLEKRK
jgi:hypothetical protein